MALRSETRVTSLASRAGTGLLLARSDPSRLVDGRSRGRTVVSETWRDGRRSSWQMIVGHPRDLGSARRSMGSAVAAVAGSACLACLYAARQTCARRQEGWDRSALISLLPLSALNSPDPAPPVPQVTPPKGPQLTFSPSFVDVHPTDSRVGVAHPYAPRIRRAGVVI